MVISPSSRYYTEGESMFFALYRHHREQPDESSYTSGCGHHPGCRCRLRSRHGPRFDRRGRITTLTISTGSQAPRRSPSPGSTGRQNDRDALGDGAHREAVADPVPAPERAGREHPPGIDRGRMPRSLVDGRGEEVSHECHNQSRRLGCDDHARRCHGYRQGSVGDAPRRADREPTGDSGRPGRAPLDPRSHDPRLARRRLALPRPPARLVRRLVDPQGGIRQRQLEPR